MTKCLDHLEFTNSKCPDCGLEVDSYGNTEAQLEYCCFPDCGCDGARLCMAEGGANSDAMDMNVEGMWSLKTPQQRIAVGKLMNKVCQDPTKS